MRQRSLILFTTTLLVLAVISLRVEWSAFDAQLVPKENNEPKTQHDHTPPSEEVSDNISPELVLPESSAREQLAADSSDQLRTIDPTDPSLPKELREALARMNWSHEGLELVEHSDGRLSVDTSQHFQHMAVIKTNARGETIVVCAAHPGEVLAGPYSSVHSEDYAER
ncbi:MAG: hypothetical protein AAFX93_13615 [Verrucomicrobiota bacterium]